MITVCSLLGLLTGCKKDTIQMLEGNIVGFVSLIDESGREMMDRSGVKIQIENTAYKAVTNQDGRFELKNVQAGTYNILIHKEGFGRCQQFSFQFVGGELPALLRSTTLYQQPGYDLESIDIVYQEECLHIGCKVTATNQFSVQTFISRTPDVSCSNYEWASHRQGGCCMPFTHFTHTIYLNDSPFKKGDTIYLAIYFINNHEETGYYNYITKKYVFRSFKKAFNVIPVTLE